MNERIKGLAEQAGVSTTDHGRGPFIDDDVSLGDLERFAELIVKECTGLCDRAAEESARTFCAVTETQEMGPALVAKGSQIQAEKLSRQIREHFGVGE